MSLLHCSFHVYCRPVPVLFGVQLSFNATNFRAVSVYLHFPPKMHAVMHIFTCHKQGGIQGRMCEVGPPASGLSFFTCPYSHLSVLNGNPALRGCFQA